MGHGIKTTIYVSRPGDYTVSGEPFKSLQQNKWMKPFRI